MRLFVTAACLVALVGGLTGCGGEDDSRFVVTQRPTELSKAPSRDALLEVAARTRVTADDFPEDYVRTPVGGQGSNDRSSGAFAACLGFSEALDITGRRSDSFQNAALGPSYEFNTLIARQDPEAAEAAVRQFAGPKGPECFEPGFRAFIEATSGANPDVTVEDVQVVSVPQDLTRRGVAAAGAIRATAVLRDKNVPDALPISIDIVLMAEQGFVLGLYALGQGAVPPAAERDGLAARLAVRLVKAIDLLD